MVLARGTARDDATTTAECPCARTCADIAATPRRVRGVREDKRSAVCRGIRELNIECASPLGSRSV